MTSARVEKSSRVGRVENVDMATRRWQHWTCACRHFLLGHPVSPFLWGTLGIDARGTTRLGNAA